jgi:hypothetical protein
MYDATAAVKVQVSESNANCRRAVKGANLREYIKFRTMREKLGTWYNFISSPA